MGLFDWLANLFRPKGETPDEVADRLERFGDRFRNAGDLEAEQAARIAAAEARRAPDGPAALRIEFEFLRSRGLGPDGRPPRPVRGQLGSGPEYVRYGNRARAGGSRSWRYHNPGYVRCSDRATRYGAIGCDGEYAIFPDERTGMSALSQTLRDEYPNHSLHDALREQLPPGADATHIEEHLQHAGLTPDARVGDLTPEQLDATASACRDAAGWESGEVLDRDTSESGESSGTGGTDWSEVWSDSSAGDARDSGDSGSSQPTDNS